MYRWIEVKYKRLIKECAWCGAKPDFLIDKYSLVFECNSCINRLSLKDYLEETNPELHQLYLNDLKQITGIPYHPIIDKNNTVNEINHTPFDNLDKVSDLEVSHPAKQFVDNRKIPSHWQEKIYYVDNVYEWAKKYMPEVLEKCKDADVEAQWHEMKFERSYNKTTQIRYWYDELINVANLKKHEKANSLHSVVIPLCDKDNNCVGAVCRNIMPEETHLRFMRVNWVQGASYMFGLEDIDMNKTIYVMEGHMDKMFVPNSVSIGGVHFGLVWQRIIDIPFDKAVIVLDNEPGDRYNQRMYGNALLAGYKVFMWPEHLHHKDINELAMDGYSSEQIKEIIDNNTFQGEEHIERLTF